MKVLIGMTRSDTTLSGSFTHIRQIGEKFRDRGAEVVYVMGSTGIANEKLRQAGFRVHELPLLKREIRPFADILVLLQLIWLILKERPQVCSWHTAKIGAIGRVAATITLRRSYYVAHGVPFVNTPLNKGYRLYEFAEHWLAFLPSKIICVCKFDQAEYLRIGVDGNKLMTIPNGMRGSKADTATRSLPPHDRVRFITAARFESQKDYVTLAEACKRLVSKNLSFELHIFGNGPQEDSVRKLFDELPKGITHFRGVVDDFSAELLQHEVYLLSSHWEGLPRSIIEAMACGMPVVATDVGGVSELVDDGVNGALVPVRDFMAFSAGMERYIQDRQLIAGHGNEGKRKFQEDYTLDVMLDRYCHEYLGSTRVGGAA